MNPESLYIIENNISECYIVLVLAILFGCVFLGNYFKDYKDLPKGEYPKPTALVTSIAIFTISPLLIYQFEYKKWTSLPDNSGEVIGTTIERGCPARGGCWVEFNYVVNDTHYTSKCGYTYDGKHIKGINYTGGRYVVIYNTKNPKFAVMDFKRPE
ncbi:hypothetical protein [Roseivirga pacifica]|uniref:hypothetical protein n=1 Tax=Roseivirga pacifica TaxID=1267423 RepID=UPI003BB0FCD9